MHGVWVRHGDEKICSLEHFESLEGQVDFIFMKLEDLLSSKQKVAVKAHRCRPHAPLGRDCRDPKLLHLFSFHFLFPFCCVWKVKQGCCCFGALMSHPISSFAIRDTI